MTPATPGRGAPPVPSKWLININIRALVGPLLACLVGALAAPGPSPVTAQPGAGFVERPARPGARAGVSGRAGGFTIARLKSTGGGDWYSDETSLITLPQTLRARGGVRVAQEKGAVVTAADPEL